MASSGKKGRKNKGTVISLQSFLIANGDIPAGTTQVAKKIRNIDGDDSDDCSNSMPMVVQLPTAPRATRIFDDDSIPHKPPFIAYVTNLPFDADEDDIQAFFGAIPIVSLRLPREDGENGRVRGFGYVEFETRDDLIDVLRLPDPSIKGRRIRIELSNEQEQQSNRRGGGGGGNRRGFDNFGNSGENRDSTNWRRDPQSQDLNNGSSSYSNNYERGGGGGSGFNRDRKHDDSTSSGSWRTGSRPTGGSSTRNDGRWDNGMRSRNYDREDRNENETPQDRPKLIINKRTLPLPEIITKVEESKNDTDNDVEDKVIEKEEEENEKESTKPVKPAGVPSEKVFGSAKPVDTAAREIEIEQRLAEAKRRQLEEEEDVSKKVSEIHLEKTEKENANSAISWRRRSDAVEDSRNFNRKYSPDRRQDDRRRDNRDRDYDRRNKNYERNNDRSNNKPQQNKDKSRDDSKSKREHIKAERPLPKLQPTESVTPYVKSSNKYEGLQDELSD